MMIVHAGTQILTQFALVDDDGDTVDLQTHEEKLGKFSVKEFVAAFGRAHTVRDRLAASVGLAPVAETMQEEPVECRTEP